MLDDRPLDLTAREFELLHTFLAAPGGYSPGRCCWPSCRGYDFYRDERVVDSHIKNLRHKLGGLARYMKKRANKNQGRQNVRKSAPLSAARLFSRLF